MGLRPKRSLIAPINGAAANWDIAYVPVRKPRVVALVVNCSNKKGNKGKTIVSPNRSSRSVIKAPKMVGIFSLLKANSS